MQANPVHITVPGIPSHLVFSAATLSPNPAINAIIAEMECSPSRSVPLSALAAHSQGRHGHGNPTSFFFVATPSPKTPQNNGTQDQGENGPQLYHGDDSGACQHIHTLVQVRFYS